jgi:hypothetical protein
MANVEVVVCPCGQKQKLALQPYIVAGAKIVCANPGCNRTLRVVQRNPARVEELSPAETRNADSAPESYS